jgi:hypothetical protein
VELREREPGLLHAELVGDELRCAHTLAPDLAHETGERLEIVAARRTTHRLLGARHLGGEVRSDDRDPRPREARTVERWRGFLDVVPQRAAQLDRTFDGEPTLGMVGAAEDRAGRERDAQLAGRALDLGRERTRHTGCTVRSAELGATLHVEQERTVADRSCEHVLYHEARPALEDQRTIRRSPARRFQADQAAACSGNADRSAAIARTGDRNHARGDGRSGAAARATRRVCGAPGILRRTVQRRLRDADEAELGRVRLADEHEPGLAPTLDDLAVDGRHVVLEQARSRRRRHAADVRHEIFDEHRYARERALGEPVSDRGAGRVEQGSDHRVERRIAPLDALDCGLQQLTSADFALAHQPGHRRGVEVVVFRQPHAASPITPPGLRRSTRDVVLARPMG